MPAAKGTMPPAAGKGRKPGSKNKTTALLKDAVLEAATLAGGREGLVGYLKEQAEENPGPFLALLGKVLPVQVDGTLKHTVSAEPMSEHEWTSRYGADLEAAARPAEKPH